MKPQRFHFTFFLLICLSIPLTATGQTVDIPDPNLRAAIEAALNKQVGSPITKADIENLTHLQARQRTIRILTGLELATNLESLNLADNSISDISSLMWLTKLTSLELNNNSVSDISSLQHLTHLRSLGLSGNGLSDLSALVPVLSGLINLTELNLSENGIRDISALAILTTLPSLNLSNNSILDISPLVKNTVLGNENVVFVENNPLSYPSLHTHIPVLQARGVEIDFNNRIPTTLLKISGTVTESDNVLVVEIRDKEGQPFAEVPVRFTVTAGGGTLSVEKAETDENGRAESTLTIGSDGDTNTVSASIEVEGISETVTFSNVVEEGVHIPEPNLRGAIERVLGKAPGTPITAEEMATLTSLKVKDEEIRVLTGLEHATNLTSLVLSENGISDLLPLAGLTKLTNLALDFNSISDISALVGLTNLTSLNLSFNSISNISSLAGLTNLTSLYLSDNWISDISALAGLTNLTSLVLWRNPISDISALVGLTNLTSLWFGENSISDISAVASLVNLTLLSIGDNWISNISALVDLTNLTSLRLQGNWISDISALAGLTNLTSLYLSDNWISDISALAGLTNLMSLDLNGNSISDISVVGSLTNLTSLSLAENLISDISALADLTILTSLNLPENLISDISALTGLTNLISLFLNGNSISDISALAGLTNLTWLYLNDNLISDIAPLVANTELGDGNTVSMQGNPLSYASFYTYIPTLQSRGVNVRFDDSPPVTIEFDLSLPLGISLIHVPLKVTAVDGGSKTIKSVGDLYDALGGTSTVALLITYNTQTQRWNTYLGDRDRGKPSDKALTDDLGIIASMRAPVSVRLQGDALGTNGRSSITLQPGTNLVGVPLKDSRITRVSDLFALEGIGDNVVVIIVSDNGVFKVVARAGDAGDVELTGGQSFILTARQAATVPITGDGWTTQSNPPTR